MVVPPFHTPKWSFFVRKPMGLLGKPTIFRKPPYHPWALFRQCSSSSNHGGAAFAGGSEGLEQVRQRCHGFNRNQVMRPKVGVGFSEVLFGWRMGLGLSTKLVVSKLFLIFIPDPLGRWSNLTSIVQLGWNHQLVQALFGWCFEILFYLRFSAQAYQRQPCHSKGDMMIWSNLTIDTAYFSSGWLETTTKLFK